ncbi:MAG TPA: alpha/beta fold hydrolase [Saprospiraceae bacterium]|nr:alpha/beta fold hydrolase [Saprospiraceae bacterium]
MSDKRNKAADLRGLTRLLKEATLGVTDVVEAMHRRIVHPPFLPSTDIQHLITDIAGFTYKNIKWSTRLIGGGLDRLLGRLTPLINEGKTSTQRERIRAVLNGVLGDHLEATDNPLQIKMIVRCESEYLELRQEKRTEISGAVNGKILLMIHGSCMNERQWTRKGHNHGLALAQELDKTALFLHYNSGRHISSNGQDLSALLEDLVRHWPVPPEEIVILGHSMGGLVARSAVHYAREEQKDWPRHLKKMVFLGTPHQGALLERSGNYLDVLLDKIHYTRPLARLGKIRSAGVTDLRYGSLLDEDWQDKDRFDLAAYGQSTVPLPREVDCYSIAAVKNKGTKLEMLQGDGLVGLKSALGQHKDAKRDLQFEERNTWIAYGNGHLDLLNDPSVYAKIQSWLD